MASLAFLRFTSSAYVESTSSKGLRGLGPSSTKALCFRVFSTTTPLHSGHSRWSKIKHDKSKADARTSKERTLVARAIEAASKEGGTDPRLNSKLPPLFRQAASVGFTKASISAALARGQGLGPTGTALLPYTIEIMHAPTGAAGIVDCLTDNKAKTLQNVRECLRSHDATTTATEWMFERRGRIVFGRGNEVMRDEESEAQEQLWDEDREMEFVDAATTAGALDVEFPLSDEDSAPEDLEGAAAVVYTDPQQMTAVANGMSEVLGMKPERVELVWMPKSESVVAVSEDSQEAESRWASLDKLVQRIESESTVQTVWLNVK